jgi:radical SAM superfamily enzyme YgiQ (UPF0313 family)
VQDLGGLLTGFESGDEKILKNIKKIATIEDNTSCVEIAKRNNLKVKALMSIGHAGESRETVENTKNWLLEVKPDDFDCTIITTYPGSPYFDNAEKQDDIYVYSDPSNGDKIISVLDKLFGRPRLLQRRSRRRICFICLDRPPFCPRIGRSKRRTRKRSKRKIEYSL